MLEEIESLEIENQKTLIIVYLPLVEVHDVVAHTIQEVCGVRYNNQDGWIYLKNCNFNITVFLNNYSLSGRLIGEYYMIIP